MWKSVLSFLLVLIAFDQRASAQRFEAPRIPHPISVADLKRYGDVLGLSTEQEVGIETAYDEYLDAFDPLRREMIEAAVANPEMSRHREAFTALLPPFIERTRMFDSAFFDAIEPLLIESQREILPRVRDLRDRSMLSRVNALWRFIGDGIPDLRALLESTAPAHEVLEPHLARLADYEQKLTTGLRQCFDAAMRLCSSTEPDDQAIDRFVDGVKALRALNRRCFDEISATLPESVRTAWRDEFLPRAYGHAASIAELHVLSRIDAALAIELTEPEHAALQALRAQAAEYETLATREMLDLFDANAISKAPQQGAVPEPGYYEAVNAKQQEVMKREGDFLKSLRDAIGDERVKALQPKRGRFVRTSGALYSACGVRTNINQVFDPDELRGVPFGRSDGLLPAPFDAECGALLAAALQLNQQQSIEVVNRLTNAQTALDEVLKPLHQELLRASMRRSPGDMSTGDPLELAQKADAVRTHMRTLINEAHAAALDETRSSLGVSTEDPRWQRLSRVFARRQITLDFVLWNQNKPNSSGDIDVIVCLLQCGLDEATWAALESIVAPYESSITGLRQELFEAYRPFAVQETAQRLGWRGRAHETGDESLHAKYRAVAALNRETVDRLTTALPPESAAAFRDRFERAAYPLAFNDRHSAAPMLQMTASWSDLTEAQRSRIGELRIALNETIERIQREMVQACAVVAPDMPAIGLSWTSDRATQHERFTLEFERLIDQRAQANRRAVRGLRLTLTPEQLQRLATPETK